MYHADDHHLIREQDRAAQSGHAEAGRKHDEHGRSRRLERNEDLTDACDSPGTTQKTSRSRCYEKFPDLDPTQIRYTDLHQWITELDDFKDDPKTSTEGKLEAIQMAWLEEYQDSQE